MRPLVVLLFLVGCKQAEPEPVPPLVTLSWFEADSAQPLAPQLAEQAQLAQKSGKKPHAYLHAAWCPPCVEIEKTRLADHTMQAAFASTHIIAIDVDDVEHKQIIAAGMNAQVLPIFYRLDDKGIPIGTSIDGGAWGDNTPAKMAPQLTAYFSK